MTLCLPGCDVSRTVDEWMARERPEHLEYHVVHISRDYTICLVDEHLGEERMKIYRFRQRVQGWVYWGNS